MQQYTKFISLKLNKSKFQYILKYTQKINLCKNQLSTIYFKKFYRTNINKSDFYKAMVNSYINETYSLSNEYFEQLCNTIYNKYLNIDTDQPILFNKLEFWHNDIKIFKNIIELNLNNRKIVIPFQYSSNYHGKLKQYDNYQCILNPVTQCIVIKTMNNKINTYQYTYNKILGVDINVTSNLFTCSDGYIIDHNRNLINKIIKQTKQSKFKIKNYNRCHAYMVLKLVELIRYAKNNGYDHLAFEDLSPFINEVNKNNTYMHLLHIFDIHNIAKSLGKKYKIGISFVPAAYTSKTCPICGYIAENSRIDQSHFNCIHCGYQANADVNAAINIRQRIASKALREQLTNNINNQFIPKVLSTTKIYQILRNFYIDRA